MSRSFRKALVWVSCRRGIFHKRRERHKVCHELNRAVCHGESPRERIVEADSRELGKDEWGTRLGFEFRQLENEGDVQGKDKLSRK